MENKEYSKHHCTAIEQKRIVDEMNKCDKKHKSYEDRHMCYFEVAQNSHKRERACMFS